MHIHITGLVEALWDPARFKVLYGGRGGGKSYAVADTLLLKGVFAAERILCAREIQGSGSAMSPGTGIAPTRETTLALLSDRVRAVTQCPDPTHWDNMAQPMVPVAPVRKMCIRLLGPTKYG